jgi:putative membrane protein
VFFVIWALRAIMGVGLHHGPRRSSGRDVLEERYARGEINRDEYLQKKKDIGG